MVPRLKAKVGVQQLWKISPFVLICIIFFDRYQSSEFHPHPEKTAPSTTTTLSAAEQQQEQDVVGGVTLEDKMNELQAMDWEIPSDIKEERHKECDGKKHRPLEDFALQKPTV
jgi:hypothetical protein